MIEIVAYFVLYSLITSGIYSKCTSTIPNDKRLEFTFRIISLSIQVYIVSAVFIAKYIYPLDDTMHMLILTFPMLTYFIFDTLTMPIYYSFKASAPFLFHHIICICLGAYSLNASIEFGHSLYIVVILYESTGAAINLQWLLIRLKRTETWCYTINGWFILIGYLSFRFGLYFTYLYYEYSKLQINEQYVTAAFVILIGIFNIMAYPQVVRFCLPAVLPLKTLRHI